MRFVCNKSGQPINPAKVGGWCMRQQKKQGCVHLLIQTRRFKDKGPRYAPFVQLKDVILLRR